MSDFKEDKSLHKFFLSRVDFFNNNFYLPEFKGNVSAYRSADKIFFSDQTVYLGSYIGFNALMALGSDQPEVFFENARAALLHITNDLAVPRTISGKKNKGYFVRDSITQTAIAIAGKTYQVQSDGQKSVDNEMSQDQLVHVLRGYFLLRRAIDKHIGNPNSIAGKLKPLLVGHTDDIGKMLKAQNYMILNPENKPVARGPDARAFAWPIASTIATITEKPISTYLESITWLGVESGKEIKMNETETKELFSVALDGLTAGVCDLKVGEEKKYLCHRFTLALINNLCNTSGMCTKKPLYTERMDHDGDYFQGLINRLTRREKRLPDVYFSELQEAQESNFRSTDGSELWCTDDRWIRMPKSCPEKSDTEYLHTGLDFLNFYALFLAKQKGNF